MEHVLLESSDASLAAAAGWIASAMDKRQGTRNAWTMMVYEEILQKGKINLEYLYRLERTIQSRWPEGEAPPRVEQFFNPKHLTSSPF
jgi:hypothetical protein